MLDPNAAPFGFPVRVWREALRVPREDQMKLRKRLKGLVLQLPLPLGFKIQDNDAETFHFH